MKSASSPVYMESLKPLQTAESALKQHQVAESTLIRTLDTPEKTRLHHHADEDFHPLGPDRRFPGIDLGNRIDHHDVFLSHLPTGVAPACQGHHAEHCRAGHGAIPKPSPARP
ncbi:hypothetical protein DESC_290228 [Desulfosarcina cetonica]|nr:hypothetical protein DESC_290228 [Desulfosarcina cetonica]